MFANRQIPDHHKTVSVTTYDPDSLDEYLRKEGNLVIYDKQKNGESRSKSSSSVLSLSNDSPFALSITDSSETDKKNTITPESPERNYSLAEDETSSDTDSQNEDIGEVIRKRYGSAVTDELIQAFKFANRQISDLHKT